MKALKKLLDGHKMNIGFVAFGLLGAAFTAGWVNAETAAFIASFLTSWTGVAVRSAWAKRGAKK